VEMEIDVDVYADVGMSVCMNGCVCMLVWV